jgi:hypothetical protein
MKNLIISFEYTLFKIIIVPLHWHDTIGFTMKFSVQKNCLFDDEIDFSSAESTLLANAFRVIKKSDTSIEFSGRGMNSTKENPIRGATKISLNAQPGTLHLNANLGGVLFMSLLVCFLPPVLILMLSSINPQDSGIISYLWIWLIMGPMIAYRVRRRTIRALNRMLDQIISNQATKKKY